MQSLDSSLQRQLSIDLSSVSSPSDIITQLQLFNIDIVEFARENVGLFLMVFIRSFTGCTGLVAEHWTHYRQRTGSTLTWSTAINLEQVANLLYAQANSASYPQWDGK